MHKKNVLNVSKEISVKMNITKHSRNVLLICTFLFITNLTLKELGGKIKAKFLKTELEKKQVTIHILLRYRYQNLVTSFKNYNVVQQIWKCIVKAKVTDILLGKNMQKLEPFTQQIISQNI